MNCQRSLSWNRRIGLAALFALTGLGVLGLDDAVAGEPDCFGDLICNNGNPCTEDLCIRGSCVNNPVDDGTPCPDGQFCTGENICISGTCTPDPPCTDPDFCIEEDAVCVDAFLMLNLREKETCFNESDSITITIDMSNSGTPIVGGQFFLMYDSTAWQFPMIVPGDSSVIDGWSELFENIDDTNGFIEYAVRRFDPVAGLCVGGMADGKPCADDSDCPEGGSCDGIMTLATITMKPFNDNCNAALRFDPDHLPPQPIPDTPLTQLVRLEGEAIGLKITDNEILAVLILTPPTATCPLGIESFASTGQCSAVVDPGTASCVDNCGESCAVTCERTDDVGVSCFAPTPYPVGTTNLTWTATDCAGNTDTCPQNITILDAQLPTIVCPANASVTTDAGACSAVVDPGQATCTDNCECNVMCEASDGLGCGARTYQVGTTTLTWTAIDASGNSAICEQSVTVSDVEPPNITCPLDVVQKTDPGECSAIVIPGSATCIDHCECVVTCEASDGLGCGVRAYPAGTTALTWTAKDPSGNTATCEQTVTVIEHEPPTVTCPPDIVTTSDPGECSAVVGPGIAPCTDNCDVCDVTCERGDGLDCFANTYLVGTTTLTWTATDPSGNSTACEQTVTVNDNELPIIMCPLDIVTTADGGECSAILDPVPATCTDNCNDCDVTCEASDGLLGCGVREYPVGTTTLTWTATDPSGNVTTCEQKVTVNDNEPPNITCPLDVVQETDLGECSAIVDPGAATCIDHCECVVTCEASDGLGCGVRAYPAGTTALTWTAKDPSGNTATCEQTVTVIEHEPPTVTCPPDIVLTTDPGKCSAVVGPGVASCTDNCECNVTCEASDGLLGCGVREYPVGTTTLTWTATDPSGNPTTCEQTVTVNDNELSTITCPLDIVTPADEGQCSAIVDPVPATCTDNCECVVTCEASDGLGCGVREYSVGTTTLTWTATDPSGNPTTCEQSINVDAFSVEITLELQGVVPIPQMRCITFELFDCATGQDSCVVEKDIIFNGACSVTSEPCDHRDDCDLGVCEHDSAILCSVSAQDCPMPNECVPVEMCVATAMETLCIPETMCVLKDFHCITARDRLHTLRRTADIIMGIDLQRIAAFEELLGGNLNDDCFIDIIDFAILAAQCGDSLDPVACVNLPDGLLAPNDYHADIDGNGTVDCTVDFSWIGVNFLNWSDLNCCGAAPECNVDPALDLVTESGPQTSISVEELRELGLSFAVGADLNRDNVVDLLDVEAFMNGVRPINFSRVDSVRTKQEHRESGQIREQGVIRP